MIRQRMHHWQFSSVLLQFSHDSHISFQNQLPSHYIGADYSLSTPDTFYRISGDVTNNAVPINLKHFCKTEGFKGLYSRRGKSSRLPLNTLRTNSNFHDNSCWQVSFWVLLLVLMDPARSQSITEKRRFLPSVFVLSHRESHDFFYCMCYIGQLRDKACFKFIQIK